MKNKLKNVIVVSLLFGASSFNSAKAITADELVPLLNGIFTQINQAFAQIGQVLDDHETRISNIEDAFPNMGGYSMGFSADGGPKNVVVATEVQENGDIFYHVRSRYATSLEQISINGVLTQRPFIANYAFVHTDSNGTLITVSNYIEAPDTDQYIVYNVEASNYDPVSLVKTVVDDTLREDWSLCKYGQITICMPDVSLSQTGEHVRTYTWSSIRGLSGPLNLNGMTFTDVRLEQNISSNNARARAKGIGEVFRAANDGSWERRAIYYRANGVSGGSLAGTPFDVGQPLFGEFF